MKIFYKFGHFQLKTVYLNSICGLALKLAFEKPSEKSKLRHSDTRSFVINKNTRVVHILNYIISISVNNFWLNRSLMVRYRQEDCLLLNCPYVEISPPSIAWRKICSCFAKSEQYKGRGIEYSVVE